MEGGDECALDSPSNNTGVISDMALGGLLDGRTNRYQCDNTRSDGALDKLFSRSVEVANPNYSLLTAMLWLSEQSTPKPTRESASQRNM